MPPAGQRSRKIQELTQGGGPEYAERSGAWNVTPFRFRSTCSVVNEQQDIAFLLRQKDRCSLARVDMLQRRVVLIFANRSYLQPLGP